jgi:hypothetical protein
MLKRLAKAADYCQPGYILAFNVEIQTKKA